MQNLIPDSPRAVSADSVLGDYIQPNFGHALSVWWAFFWPTTLIGGILGFLFGIFVWVLIQKTGIPPHILLPIARYGGFILDYVAALFVMQYILRKTFRRFRIGLVTRWGAGASRPLEPTFERTLRVWWTYVWRTIVYAIVAWVVVMLPLGAFMGVVTRSAVVAKSVSTIVAFLIRAAVALYTIYSYILDEDMGDFRVCLLPRGPSPNPLPSPSINDLPAAAPPA